MKTALLLGTILLTAALAQPGGGGGPGGIVTDFTGLGTVTVDSFLTTGTATADSIYVRGQHVAVHVLMDSAFASMDSLNVDHVTGVTTWTGTNAVVSGIENLGVADLTVTDSTICVTVDATGDIVTTADLYGEDATLSDSLIGVTADLTGTLTGVAADFTGAVTGTIATTVTGGITGLYSYIEHADSALTGSIIGVRGNARINAIDSGAGTVVGGYFQAGNATVGSDIAVVRGVYAEIVNKTPVGATTWDYARGVEVCMDLNQGTLGNVNTTTLAQAFYACFNLPTVNTYATVATGYGVHIRNEAVGGTGQMLDAGFYLDDLSHSGGIYGWDYGLDFSGIGANSGAFGSADIRGCNGETIDNNTDGYWTLVADNYTLGGNTIGDVDCDIYWDSGGATVKALSINYGQGRWQTNNLGMYVDGLLTSSSTIRLLALLESSGTAMTIDPETAGVGTLNLGLRGEKDLLLINSNLFNFGDGTDGDFDIVCQADTGSALFTLWQYDEGDEQLEFPVPVQVAELDIVEAGDAVSLGAWTRYLMITAGSATLGPTAPSWLAAGQAAGGLGFDADAEIVYITQEVPDDWDGASDVALKIYWVNEPGDALTNGQTVIWLAGWRSLVWGGGSAEDIDNGTEATGSVTYTEASSPGGDGDTHEHSITIPYTGGNQPLVAGDVLTIRFSRDEGNDTYDSQAVVVQWELVYTSTGLPNHN